MPYRYEFNDRWSPPSVFNCEWEPDSAMPEWALRAGAELRYRYQYWRNRIYYRCAWERRRDRLRAVLLAGIVFAVVGAIIQIHTATDPSEFPLPKYNPVTGQ